MMSVHIEFGDDVPQDDLGARRGKISEDRRVSDEIMDRISVSGVRFCQCYGRHGPGFIKDHERSLDPNASDG